MDYTVRLVYMDDKTQDIIIPSERFGDFENCLKTKSVYWYDDDKAGFWTDTAHVRNVRFQKGVASIAPQQPETKTEEETPKDECASEHNSPDICEEVAEEVDPA